MRTSPVVHREQLSVSIDRPAAEAYDFLCAPENFPRWASRIAEAPVRFSERNKHGVLDYSVTPPGGSPIYVPLRLVASGAGCELVLTLFRRADVSDAQFAADAQWAMRDLHAAKRLLEQ